MACFRGLGQTGSRPAGREKRKVKKKQREEKERWTGKKPAVEGKTLKKSKGPRSSWGGTCTSRKGGRARGRKR